MTSVMPPSYAFVKRHGELLTQLGATKIETPDAFQIKLTYVNNAAAVNAKAAFSDSVWGAKLLVDNQSTTLDMPAPSMQGLQALLSGVPRLETSIATARCPGGGETLLVASPDKQAVEGLQALLRTEPLFGGGNAHVAVFHKPAGEPPASAAA